MKYTVLITNSALGQLEEAFLWLSARTEMHAPTWYNGMLDAINSLEDMRSVAHTCLTMNVIAARNGNCFTALRPTFTGSSLSFITRPFMYWK